MTIAPFQVAVPEAVLDDLRQRLERTRWPDEIPGAGWAYGFNLGYLKELTEYWRTRFDWRAQEKRINSLPHFRAPVDGIGLHFIHARGRGPDPLPLVLTHGWPGSFLEMLDILPLLSDPAGHGGDARDSFDVVVPSIPGFGFSDRPAAPGMDTFRVADLWLGLMDALGYRRFGMQGGDFGANVSSRLAFLHPERVIGLHLNYIPGSYRPYLGPGAPPLTPAEEKFQRDDDAWYDADGGYAHVQRTRPQTLAVAIHDSPAGLCAWLVEKYREWADCGGEVERRFSKDELLAHVTIYWVTETFTLRRGCISNRLSARCTSAAASASPCRWAWRAFRWKRPSRRASGWSAPTTSSAGPSCRAAATSPRWKSRSCWRKTCAPSSALCAGEGGTGKRSWLNASERRVAQVASPQDELPAALTQRVQAAGSPRRRPAPCPGSGVPAEQHLRWGDELRLWPICKARCGALGQPALP